VRGWESVPRRTSQRHIAEHWLHRTPSALKHFFDTVYYPVMDDTAGRPYAAFVHGNSDTGGAVRAIESITKGMGWKRVRDPVEVVGDPSRDDLDACWELGATLAAHLQLG
jgi:multimeric flavodoxin WrbA